MADFNESQNEVTRLSEDIDVNMSFQRSASERVSGRETVSKTEGGNRPPGDRAKISDSIFVTPTYNADGSGTIRMIYGGYEFEPTPLITFGREIVRDDAQNKLYERITITCEGAIVLTDSNPASFGRLDEQKFKALEAALAIDKQRLTITHDEGFFVDDVYPLVEGFQTERSLWFNLVRYTFSFVYDVPVGGISPVESFSDNWDFSENEDSRVEVSHTVNAKGLNTSETGGNNALQNAKDFCSERLGSDNIPSTFPPQISAIYGNGSLITFIRRLYTESINEAENSYSVTENFILVTGTDLEYIQKRTYDYSVAEDGIVSLTVTGEILGQGTNAADRYSNAVAGWAEVQNTLYEDASTSYEELGGPSTLSTNELSKSVTKNEYSGIINFTIVFSDKIDDPNAENIVDSSFNISKKNPVPRYAVIDIPGRAVGPVWQDLGTIGEGSYTISGRIVGITIDDAVNYAQYLISQHSGDTVGSRSRITDHQFDRDILTNTVTFSITWAFIGTEASGNLS